MFTKILAVLVILIAAALSASAQTFSGAAPAAAVTGIENAFLAKADDDGKAGEPAGVFEIDDVPIFCVVRLDSLQAVTVKLILVAVKVPGVKAGSNVVSISYKTNGMQDRVDFEGRPDGHWVAGSYRADIYLDNKIAKAIDFDIGNPAKPQPEIKTTRKRLAGN
jgi:hypothetical protein